MVARNELVIPCFDLGTTDLKIGNVTVSPDGNLIIGAETWNANVTTTLDIGDKHVRSWWGSTLESNMANAKTGIAKLDGLGGTGVSGSALSVVDKKTGRPLVVFYDKPTLMASSSLDTTTRMGIARVPENADPFYVWSKALAVREHLAQIAQLIGEKIDFDQIGIEPLVSTYARMFAGIGFGDGIGFGPDEFKGATGNPDAGYKRVKKALNAFGYDNSQFHVERSRYNSEHRVYLAGDFPLVLEHINAAIESSAIPRGTILVESDSNFKVYTRNPIPLKVSLKRYNKSYGFAYSILRNGAGVNNNILRPYLLPKELNEADWYYRADQVAGQTYESLVSNKNPYIYMPGSTDSDLGAMYKLDGDLVPHQLSLIELSEIGNDRSMIISAIYAGVIAELRYKLSQVKAETGKNNVAIHGGFIKHPERNIYKRKIFAGMLGKEFNVSLLEMPDPSTLAGISTATHLGNVNINYKDLMKLEVLEDAPSLEAYYHKWLRVRRQLI